MLRRIRRAAAGLLALSLTTAAPVLSASSELRDRGPGWWCGTYAWGIEAALARHELNRRRLSRRLSAQSVGGDVESLSGPAIRKERHVAVIQDDGSLVIERNPFDYENRGARFRRQNASTYKVSGLGGSVSSNLGERLALGDDDSARIDFPGFSVRFYERQYSSVWVNSDGNLTFGEPENASTARDVPRMLNGPPRVSPFFADLNPATALADGGVYVRFSGPTVIVTWWKVPEFDTSNSNTFQLVMNASGRIDVRFGAMDAREGIVGIAPGGGSGLELVDLTRDLPIRRQGVAIVERFANSRTVDEAAVAQAFYGRFADQYDQLVLFTDFDLLLNDSIRTIAFHLTVQNRVRGIGRSVHDASRFFGSGGRLGGFINMGGISRYPNNVGRPIFIDDLYSPLDVLAHEIGHQWLVGARFIDDNGRTSDELLGRDSAHWSFYFDSDASFLEGNEIRDNGDGTFTTLRKRATYNSLDRYLMGLIPAQQVPGFILVRPNNSRDTDTAAPEAGVTFAGTRVDLTINDIVAAMGPRRPSAEEARKSFRIGFILLARQGQPASPESISRVNKFAGRIKGLFRNKTGRIGSINTRLVPR